MMDLDVFGQQVALSIQAEKTTEAYVLAYLQRFVGSINIARQRMIVGVSRRAEIRETEFTSILVPKPDSCFGVFLGHDLLLSIGIYSREVSFSWWGVLQYADLLITYNGKEQPVKHLDLPQYLILLAQGDLRDKLKETEKDSVYYEGL